MITKEIAMKLKRGQRVFHVKLKNADGSPLHVRVNGVCQTWKKIESASRFRLPIKRGLNEYGVITESNADLWTL